MVRKQESLSHPPFIASKSDHPYTAHPKFNYSHFRAHLVLSNHSKTGPLYQVFNKMAAIFTLPLETRYWFNYWRTCAKYRLWSSDHRNACTTQTPFKYRTCPVSRRLLYCSNNFNQTSFHQKNLFLFYIVYVNIVTNYFWK